MLASLTRNNSIAHQFKDYRHVVILIEEWSTKYIICTQMEVLVYSNKFHWTTNDKRDLQFSEIVNLSCHLSFNETYLNIYIYIIWVLPLVCKLCNVQIICINRSEFLFIYETNKKNSELKIAYMACNIHKMFLLTSIVDWIK